MDAGVAQCMSCNTGYVLGGDLSGGANGPTTCITTANSQYPKQPDNKAVDKNLVIAVACIGAAVVLGVSVSIVVCIRRRRHREDAAKAAAAEAAHAANTGAVAPQQPGSVSSHGSSSVNGASEAVSRQSITKETVLANLAAGSGQAAGTSAVKVVLGPDATQTQPVTTSTSPAPNTVVVALPEWMTTPAVAGDENKQVRATLDITIDYGANDGAASLGSSRPKTPSSVLRVHSPMQRSASVPPSPKHGALLLPRQSMPTTEDTTLSAMMDASQSLQRRVDSPIRSVSPPAKLRSSSNCTRTTSDTGSMDSCGGDTALSQFLSLSRHDALSHLRPRSPSRSTAGTAGGRNSTSPRQHRCPMPLPLPVSTREPFVRRVYSELPRGALNITSDLAYSSGSDWEAHSPRVVPREPVVNPYVDEVDRNPTRRSSDSDESLVDRLLQPSQRSGSRAGSPRASCPRASSPSRNVYLAMLSDQLHEIAEKFPVRYESSGHTTQFLSQTKVIERNPVTPWQKAEVEFADILWGMEDRIQAKSPRPASLRARSPRARSPRASSPRMSPRAAVAPTRTKSKKSKSTRSKNRSGKGSRVF